MDGDFLGPACRHVLLRGIRADRSHVVGNPTGREGAAEGREEFYFAGGAVLYAAYPGDLRVNPVGHA
ncbi:hypothetical protein D1872_262370 [compost metagenome]